MNDLTDALPDADAYASMRAAEMADLEVKLVDLRQQLWNLPEGTSALDRATLTLGIGRALAGLDKGAEAWPMAREAFDVFIAEKQWELAVDACDALFLSNQDGSLSALGQGVWLGVTFPIDPELTIAMLDHIVDETPDDSDGAAVAAATAVYIADLRAHGEDADNLTFFSRQMLGKVARRHSEVDSQDQFDAWVMRMELDDPSKFLVRLRNVVDVLVQTDWWFDRDRISSELPDE